MIVFNPLWSDVLIYVLIALLAIYTYIGKKNAHTRASWARVFARPSRVIAGIVLLLFIIIGVLDSIHFRLQSDSHAILSYLDVLMDPISQQTE